VFHWRSYFSVLLNKIGLQGICNGIFYGEYKSKRAQIGGGPSARYYIRELHDFYSISIATKILLQHPNLLDKDCKKCMDLINNDTNNIILFDKDHSLAQRHFIYSREVEIQENKTKDLNALLKY